VIALTERGRDALAQAATVTITAAGLAALAAHGGAIMTHADAQELDGEAFFGAQDWAASAAAPESLRLAFTRAARGPAVATGKLRRRRRRVVARFRRWLDARGVSK